MLWSQRNSSILAPPALHGAHRCLPVCTCRCERIAAQVAEGALHGALVHEADHHERGAVI